MLDSLLFPLSLPSDGVGSVCVARHLYGELGATREGCEVLRGSGHVEEFMSNASWRERRSGMRG